MEKINLGRIMHECTKCNKYGLHFRRRYKPIDFIEGKKNSYIWIVGLNPGKQQDWIDERTISDLESYFDDLDLISSYFKSFHSVSKVLFDGFGMENGTAHTDIVKCSSPSFLPKSIKGKDNIIDNCKIFLEEQIKSCKPKIIVCNGVDVSTFMLHKFPPPTEFSDKQTSYWSKIDGADVCVILSGFIGRIDNFSKRRLGIEIEQRIVESHTLAKE